MATLIEFNTLVFVIVSAICVFRGLDLKKTSSWLYGLYGFVSGFLSGFVRSDGNGGYQLVTDMTGSLQSGIFFAFIILVGSAVIRWQRERFKV